MAVTKTVPAGGRRRAARPRAHPVRGEPGAGGRRQGRRGRRPAPGRPPAVALHRRTAAQQGTGRRRVGGTAWNRWTPPASPTRSTRRPRAALDTAGAIVAARACCSTAWTATRERGGVPATDLLAAGRARRRLRRRCGWTGLMAVAPLGRRPRGGLRRHRRRRPPRCVRRIRPRPTLSAGMSGDLEVAIRHGCRGRACRNGPSGGAAVSLACDRRPTGWRCRRAGRRGRGRGWARCTG